MQKKGQLLGLPLVLLFGLIVGALILWYGATVILDLTSEASYVDMLGTVQDLDAQLDTFDNYDSGTSRGFDLDLPGEVEALCFYNAGKNENCVLDGQACQGEVQELAALIDDTTSNLYLVPVNLYERNRFAVSSFVVEEGNPVCISNGGAYRLTVGSQGVVVSNDE